MKVAIVGTYPAETYKKFEEHFAGNPEIEVVEIDTQEKFDALTEADAIILRIFKMPKEVVARIKGLKMIMRWGAGFDSVDIEEAGKHGIYVCNTPGANAYAVAELTVALMLAVGRKLICHDRAIHQGEWSKNTFLNLTRTLNNKVVGIIGGGNIGRQVASRVQAFGSTVQYYDPFRLPEEMEEKLHMKYVGLEELIRTSDVITLHVPLMDSTRHMIGEKEIEKMKAEAEANAEADKKEREKIDKLNQADSLIFQTETQLKELGDKLPADKKAPIEAALQKLKDAHKAQDMTTIDSAMAELNTAFQAASAEMYAQSGAQGGAQAGPDMNAGQSNAGQNNGKQDDNVQDADFEEVK